MFPGQVLRFPEVDKFAIQQTMSVFPDTIQLGDVTKVDVSQLDKIDLLIGGSRGDYDIPETINGPPQAREFYDMPEECAGCTTYLDAPRDVRVIGKSEGGAETMIRKFFNWMNSPEDVPGLVARMLTAILITVVWAFLLALIATLTMCRL